MEKNIQGALLIVIAMLMFGSYGVFLRWIPASALTILFFNQVFGALAMFIVLLKSKDFNIKGFVKPIILLAVVAVANDFFYFSAFRLTTLSNSVLTHYTAPIFVAMLVPFLIKEKITKYAKIALVLSFIGLVLILYSSGFTLNTNMIGIVFGVASGLMYAFLIISYKHLSQKSSIYTINFYRYLISLVILLPIIFIEAPAISFGLLATLFGFAMLFAIIATTLHVTGIKFTKAQHAGIIGYIEPLAAVAYGILIFSEIPSILTALGGILIITGSYLAIKKD